MRHLYTFKGFYYFRSRVPSDLQGLFQCRIIKKALKTNDFNTATSSVKLLSSEFDRVIKIIRSGILNKEQMEQLVRELLDTYLKNSDYLYLRYWKKKSKSKLLERCDKSIAHYTRLLDYDSPFIEKMLDIKLSKANITLDKDSHDYLKFKRAFLLMTIDAIKIEKERIIGNFNNWYDDFRSSLKQKDTPRLSEKKQGVLLSAVIEKFCQEKITKKEWNTKNRDENIAFYKQFIEIIGDKNIKEYIRDNFIRVVEIFKQFPLHVNKVKGLRDKPIKEIISLIENNKLSDYETLDVTTVNKNVTRFNAVFRYALQHGYITANYAEGLKIKNKKRPKDQRKIYNTEELTKWLASPVYSEYSDEKMLQKPERFWVLLIMMLNGCRTNEVCQLYKEDIKEINGIWCFDINDDKDKKVKTDESVRIVPIHPFLIKLGFLNYVKSVQHERLWSNLRKDGKDKEGYSYLFNKWSERYNRKNITSDKKKVPYSLRHNFISNLKDQEVSESIVAEISGHVVEGMTYGRYGKSYSEKTKLEAIKKLDYGIDLSRLKFPTIKKG